MHARTHACTHARTHARARAHTHTWEQCTCCTHTCTRTHACTQTWAPCKCVCAPTLPTPHHTNTRAPIHKRRHKRTHARTQVDLQGINIHPHISTVTYLTGDGAPTLVCEQRSPVSYDQVPDAFGPIPQAWLSYPLAGKHMSFDGGLLHGAPNALAPLQSANMRVTFLANVWLNYHPAGLEV